MLGEPKYKNILPPRAFHCAARANMYADELQDVSVAGQLCHGFVMASGIVLKMAEAVKGVPNLDPLLEEDNRCKTCPLVPGKCLYKVLLVPDESGVTGNIVTVPDCHLTANLMRLYPDV